MNVAREFLKARRAVAVVGGERARRGGPRLRRTARRWSDGAKGFGADGRFTGAVGGAGQGAAGQVARLTSMMAAVLGQRTGAAAETAGVTLDFGREDGGLGGGPTASSLRSQSRPLRARVALRSRIRKRRSRSGKRRIPRPSLDPRRDAGRGRRRRRLRHHSGANVRDIMSKMDLYEDGLSAVAWSPTLLSVRNRGPGR